MGYRDMLERGRGGVDEKDFGMVFYHTSILSAVDYPCSSVSDLSPW